jgi:transposase-like protein
VHRRWSARAAKRFLRKLLRGQRMVLCTIVTDRLASYTAARAVVMPTVSHICAGARTIESRTRTNLCDSGSGSCNDQESAARGALLLCV